MNKKKVGSIALSLGLCALLLGNATTPVLAHETMSNPELSAFAAVEQSWTWKAAGREAITWGVCGAVGGAAACTLGTPAMTAAAGVGAVGGAVGGFLTYAAGWGYDRLIGRYENAATTAPEAALNQ